MTLPSEDSSPDHSSSPWLKICLGASSVLLLTFAVFTVRSAARYQHEAQLLTPDKDAPQIYGHVQKFAFTDEDGKPFDSAQLNGKVWIADFFFTRCPGTCLSMAKAMRGLRQDLGPLAGAIPTVSLTMDSEFDSPSVLKEYHQSRADGLSNWFFLTGNKDAIMRLSRESFMLAAQEKIRDDGDILHSTHFVLIDKQMQIRGFYDGLDAAQVQRLTTDARKLAK